MNTSVPDSQTSLLIGCNHEKEARSDLSAGRLSETLIVGCVHMLNQAKKDLGEIKSWWVKEVAGQMGVMQDIWGEEPIRGHGRGHLGCIQDVCGIFISSVLKRSLFFCLLACAVMLWLTSWPWRLRATARPGLTSCCSFLPKCSRSVMTGWVSDSLLIH